MDYVNGPSLLHQYYDRRAERLAKPTETIDMHLVRVSADRVPVYGMPMRMTTRNVYTKPDFNLQYALDMLHHYNPIRRGVQHLRRAGVLHEGYSQLTDTYDISLDLRYVRFTFVQRKFS